MKKNFYKKPMNKWYNRRIIDEEDTTRHTVTIIDDDGNEDFNIFVTDVIS